MTKAEYLEKLQEKLQKFSNELQDEIMDDYMQHFAEGEQLGKSDEEIIAELGNIEDMIRELPEEECVEDFAGQVQASSVGNGIAETIETKSIAEIAEADAEKQFSYNGFYKGVVVDGKVADVLLEESIDGQIHVDYRNNSDLNGQLRYEFYQYEENGIFHVGVRRREGVDGGAKRKTISFFGRTISFENAFGRDDDANIQLRMQVPAGMEKLTVKTSSGEIKILNVHGVELTVNSNSGDVEMRNLEIDTFKFSIASGDAVLNDAAFKEGAMNTASGDLDLCNVTAEKFNINTASGDVSVNSVKVRNLKMNTASGDMDMFDVEAENVVFNSASGDMNGTRVMVQDTMQCSTASGDADMHGQAKCFRFGSGSGDLNLHCSGVMESVSVSTGSGDVDLRLEDVTGMELTTKVQSGDVDIDWKGQSSCIQNATGTFGDGSCKVNVKTGSGDVSIVCK